MCGIGGICRFWDPSERDLALRTPHEHVIPESWLDALDRSIRHRGPDGQGRYRDRVIRHDGAVVDVALVHRRLSIIDHAGGAQPMVSMGSAGPVHQSAASGVIVPAEDPRDAPSQHIDGFPMLFHGSPASGIDYRPVGRPSEPDGVAVVFNGCIYNHRELRAELQRAGHVFASDHSDTEVILHGWREWGDTLVERLDGMYALAIWDRTRAELFIARDRFGEKPLYLSDGHSFSGGGLRVVGFSSTLPGLARLAGAWSPPMSAASRDWAMTQFLALGWSEGSLPMVGVRTCPTGWWMSYQRPRALYSRDELHSRTGRSGRSIVVESPRPFESAADVETELFRSVASRLDADVPLGCFLSGGVDSSLVALAAMRARGALSTFTVRMSDPRMDESAHAQGVASAIGSTHTTIDANMQPATDLVRLIAELGLPFGDSSLLPTFWVSKAAREHVRVALGGDGGDELFHGYQRQAAWRWRRWIWPVRMLPDSMLARLRQGEKLRRLKQALTRGQYIELLRIFTSEDLLRLAPGLQELGERSLRMGPGDEWSTFDARKYLPQDLMRKVDTASMSVALEVRSPMLARSFADRALARTGYRLYRHGRKGLLRQVARRHLPSSIVDRPKQGFAIPVGEWFRTDFGGMRTMLLDHLNSAEPFGSPSLGIDLNMAFIRQMLDEHLGTGPSGLVVRDHSQRLYMLLVLSIWARWMRSEP